MQFVCLYGFRSLLWHHILLLFIVTTKIHLNLNELFSSDIGCVHSSKIDSIILSSETDILLLYSNITDHMC